MVANVWDVPVFAFDEWYVAQMSPLNRSFFFSLTPTFQIGARVVHTVSSQALRRHYSPHTQPQSNAQDMRQAT